MLKIKIDHPCLNGEIKTGKNARPASRGEDGNAFIEIQDHEDSCKIPLFTDNAGEGTVIPAKDLMIKKVDCHVAEFNAVRMEILGFEKRLYGLSAAYIGFFAAISGFVAKIIADPAFAQTFKTTPDNFLYALFLMMTFVNSLYNIIAASVSWSILRLGLYIRDHLSPAINTILGRKKDQPGTVWQWEALLRSDNHIGKNYPLLPSVALQHGETIFGVIIFLPTLLVSPVVIYNIFPRVWNMGNVWFTFSLMFSVALFLVSLCMSIVLLACFAGTKKSQTPPHLLPD